MLWTLKVNSRFLIWEGKIGYCYTSNRGQGQEEGMQLGPELWKNQISCSCCCCAWENRWECRKVRGGWKRWGKQLLVLGEDVFHQSPFLCHQHEVPLQTHRTAEAVGTCWGPYIYSTGPTIRTCTFWGLLDSGISGSYFACVQRQSCNIFYLMLKGSSYNLLQIYFNIRKTISMKTLEHKTFRFVPHLL